MSQISTNLSKQTDISLEDQQKLVEHINFLYDNAIIPLLETEDDIQFNLKYDQAVKYYAFYSNQLMYLFGLDGKNEDKKPIMNNSFLSILHFLREEFLHIEDVNIKSLFVNAIDNLEDYFLLARDPNIKINQPKYIAVLEFSYCIWICILGLLIVLKNAKYENKIDLLRNKCLEASERLKSSVLKIAEDHGRILSAKTTKLLDDIDSKKIEMVTQSVDEFLDKIDNELKIEK